MKYDQITESKTREDKLEVVKLPYKLGDLSPVLSKKNVDYHYNVLTKAYVRRYNEKEGDPNFNYGGAKLHNLFWSQLRKPKPGNKYVIKKKKIKKERKKIFKRVEKKSRVRTNQGFR